MGRHSNFLKGKVSRLKCILIMVRGTGMIEIITEHVNTIDKHIHKKTRQPLSVPCLYMTPDRIGDGTLQILPDGKSETYRVRIDDQESGLPIGQVNLNAWLGALTKARSNLDKGCRQSPLNFSFDLN